MKMRKDGIGIIKLIMTKKNTINILDQLIHEHGHEFILNLLNAKKRDSYKTVHEKLLCKRVFKTSLGSIYAGNSLKWLNNKSNYDSVNLIMTSPPFGLIKKKSYGNEASEDYCDWFRPFAEGFSNVLKKNGSLVIDIQGSWIKGKPIRSLYHFDLLKMLCDEYGFKLCQEHYWWNPSKLPTPAEWVTIRRTRVKDAVNCIWWLSQSDNPKANNRNILKPYSQAMQKVFTNGYNKGTRPSGHKISDKFDVNNGGAIPPNLITVSNSASSGEYFNYCKKHNLKLHPARFPYQVPEYFINFLTSENDLVFDPFGGSSTTGFVAEVNKRRWVSIEKNEEFALGGKGHFMGLKNTKKL